LRRLHAAVMETIARVDVRGACERMAALRSFTAPAAGPSLRQPPLTGAPVLVLFAENEEAVIEASSPTRLAFTTALRACFPRGECLTLANPGGAPVQHASLIFHSANFLPPVARFYRGLKARKFLQAA
ncbi:MAG TPA: hypothetical protein VIO38_05830, partial [Rariglobus sp.]